MEAKCWMWSMWSGWWSGLCWSISHVTPVGRTEGGQGQGGGCGLGSLIKLDRSAAVKPCLSFLLCHCCQANRKTFVFVLELTAYKVLDKPEQVSRPQGPQELLRHCAVHTAHQSYSTFLTSCKTSFTKSGRFTSNTRDEIYDKVLSKNNVNYCMHWSFINTNAGVSMSVVWKMSATFKKLLVKVASAFSASPDKITAATGASVISKQHFITPKLQAWLHFLLQHSSEKTTVLSKLQYF